MNTARLYRIATAEAWQAARAAGVYQGADLDRRDGFIHLSTAGQARETAALHFAGRGDLVLLAVDPAPLGDSLVWEPSRGGALFPHLYAALPVTAVRAAHPLPLDSDGRHIFPDDVA